MSDGEEDTSFLPLQPTVFPRHCLPSDLSETHATDNQQLLIQVGYSRQNSQPQDGPARLVLWLAGVLLLDGVVLYYF